MLESAGVHITIDGFVEDPSVVLTREAFEDLFIKLAATLDMTILTGPYFVEVPVDPEILRQSQETGKFHDEGGLTAFCIISTSHISVHTWPLQGFLSLDLFSCGEYEPQTAIDLIVKTLDITSASINVIRRNKFSVADVKSFVI